MNEEQLGCLPQWMSTDSAASFLHEFEDNPHRTRQLIGTLLGAHELTSKELDQEAKKALSETITFLCSRFPEVLSTEPVRISPELDLPDYKADNSFLLRVGQFINRQV